MVETWKHKVIRESLEEGLSIPHIVEKYRLSVSAILNEIDSDIELKMLQIENEL